MLFLVILVLGSLLLVDYSDRSWVLLGGVFGPTAVFFGFLALILVVLRLAELRAMTHLRGGGASVTSLQSLYSRAQRAFYALAAGGHFALLFGTTWPETARDLVGDYSLGLDELLMILPVAVLLSVGYLRLYPIDRAIREAMIADLLYLNEPVRPVWTRWQYLSFQIRFQVLLMAIPLMLIIAARDVIEQYRFWLTYAGAVVLSRVKLVELAPLTSEVMLGACAAAVVVFSPFLIRGIWYCRPLPAGPLRDQLHALAERAKLTYRDILLWPTYGVIVNAAVVGLAGRLRYVMLSDGLIESMTDGQIEGVFAHEIGHVKHYHLHFFLLFAFASIGLIGLSVWHVQVALGVSQRYAESAFFAFSIVVWFIVFGRLSRSFERQADLFAVSSLSDRFDHVPGGCGGVGCVRHGAPPQPGDLESPPLCLSAAQLVCSALGRAAALNAIPRSAKTWRHGSINGRCQRIIKWATDPRALRRFTMKMELAKIAIVVAAAGAVVWALVSLNTLQTYLAAERLMR